MPALFDMSTRRMDSQVMTLRVIAAVVSVLVLGPILVLLRASFGPAGTLPFDNWGVTLTHFAAIFTHLIKLAM